MALLMYALREREIILDLFEMVSGARLTTSYIRIGGVWQDLPPAFVPRVRDFLSWMPGRIDDYERMLTNSPVWKARTQGVGLLSREMAIAMSSTGPVLRGSGVKYDVRRARPYCGYENYDFEVPTSELGDSYGRFLVRVAEMRQSLRIIQQAVDNLPDGPYKTNDRKVALPPRAELDRSMESLIHHFKLVTEGFHVPPVEIYSTIESPKGEHGYFIKSDGGPKPYRLHIRGPSFVNMQALDHMARGRMIADLVTCIGTLDPVLGDVDR
jgi:NADH:ubiquinone oxidoreductase subunit D